MSINNIFAYTGYPGKKPDKNYGKSNKWKMYWNKFYIEYFQAPRVTYPQQDVQDDEPKQPIIENPSLVEDITEGTRDAPLMVDVSYEARGGQSGSIIYKTTPVGNNNEVKHEIVGLISKDTEGDVTAIRLTEKTIDDICNLMKNDGDQWKKQPGCPGSDHYHDAHLSEINLLQERVELMRAMRLTNEKIRRKHQYYRRHHFRH